MYDTVKMRYHHPDRRLVISRLPDAQILRWKGSPQELVLGKLGSLRVIVRPERVDVSGSFARYHRGSNLETLTKSEMREVLDAISDALKVPLARAKVHAVHVARNIILSRPVGEYFRCLGNPRRHKVHTYGEESIQFTLGWRAMALYDKIAEMRSRRELVPDHYIGTNVLRYELRFLNRLPRQLRVKEVLASDLYDEAVYNLLIDRWVSSYSSIQKIPAVVNVISFKPVKQLVAAYALCGISARGGGRKCMNEIEVERFSGRLTDVQASRARRKIRELEQSLLLTQQSGVIEELDLKIHAEADRARESG